MWFPTELDFFLLFYFIVRIELRYLSWVFCGISFTLHHLISNDSFSTFFTSNTTTLNIRLMWSNKKLIILYWKKLHILFISQFTIWKIVILQQALINLIDLSLFAYMPVLTPHQFQFWQYITLIHYCFGPKRYCVWDFDPKFVIFYMC
jgi:hypothetical protein